MTHNIKKSLHYLTFFDSLIRHLQHTGTIAGFRLIAINDKILVYLRTEIVKGVLRAIQSHIRIRHEPLFVAIGENFIERAVQHFLHGNAFHGRHFRIAVAKNKIHTVALLVKDKLYHAECQRHIVQQAAFFQHAQGSVRRVCQPYFCTQAAMTAHPALASLKSAAIRHGIHTVAADIYNVAAAYDRPLADAQKIPLRQSRQNTMHRYEQRKFLTVRALNDCFAVFAVNV